MLRCGWMVLAAAMPALATAGRDGAAVDHVRDGGPVEFGAAELETALRGRGGETRVVLTVAGTGAPEGFRVRVSGGGAGREIRIEGADAAGAMYGAMEVAETIRLGGPAAVQDLERAPHVRVRGMKLNAPLDARTPSYSDPSDAAQENIATMWDLPFWREPIDRLARERFNVVTLWSLHPFPSLVRVPEYPDVALADVRRSTTAWAEHYPLRAMGLDTPEIYAATAVALYRNPLWTNRVGRVWAWDRKIVTLRRGANRIELRPGAVVNLDHLNVLPWGP